MTCESILQFEHSYSEAISSFHAVVSEYLDSSLLVSLKALLVESRIGLNAFEFHSQFLSMTLYGGSFP